MEIGTVTEGVITGITDFGAFVKLPGGETGLVHISEVADEFVKDVRNYVSENQTVSVKVLGVNKKGKYELSIKQVSQPSKEKASRKRPVAPSSQSNSEGGGFEDMMSKWKRESEERLLDVRRNKDAKRGGGSRRGGRS